MRIWFAGGGTGGHLYPGLAIARALVAQDASVQPFFIGAQRGIERDVLPTTEFPHRLLDLHPLYRQRPWENWRTVRGALGAWRELAAIATTDGAPVAVIGTGGYAAGLALGWAARRRVPLFVQEQNSVAGMTTRFFAPWAREVYLGFPEAEGQMRGGDSTRFVDSGNPIQPPPQPRPDARQARAAWGFPREGGRVLLVYGGSQGSKSINDVVDAWVARGLPEGVHLIWITGKGSHAQYQTRESARVKVRAYLSPIADAYAAADVAVARAGAMTTAELLAWGIPALLVPLPTAAADHQTANAVALASAGAAIDIPQREFDADRLARELRRLIVDAPTQLDVMRTAAARRARPDAAARIARHILASLGR